MHHDIFDSHTHSDNSPDGFQSVTYLCEKAVEKGIMGISITDHCECDEFDTGRYAMRIRQSNFEAIKARVSFQHSLMVSAGIELGQVMRNISAADHILSVTKLDFVMASVHISKAGEDYYYLDYKSGKVDLDDLLNRYFDDVYETARWNGFDVLAHLTYPVRYIQGRDGVPVDLSRYYDKIDAILKLVAQNGKGIEINTSEIGKNLNETMPSLEILKRYRSLGGEIVTLGSDSHRAETLGSGISQGMDLLEEAGFGYFTFYKEREPRLIKIV